MKKSIQIASTLALAAVSATGARADTKVATISGCYDCAVYDTPTLVINNNTGGSMNNATLVLTGYQGLNNGQTLTILLGDLPPGSTTLNWGSLPGVSGSTTPFNLSAYDYDDEFGGTSYAINDPTCGGSGCVAGGGPYWYAQTGNFNVTFTALISGGTYDGQNVYSVFSPHVNATGSFVGWEGLDESGYSESSYDVHSGVITGELADIFLGQAPAPPTTGAVPEPSTWAMMLLGFGAIGFAMRHRRRALPQLA